jgi:hypothetical protein
VIFFISAKELFFSFFCVKAVVETNYQHQKQAAKLISTAVGNLGRSDAGVEVALLVVK